MTLLLILLAGGVTLSTFLRNKDFFHPSRIYILVYALLFAVYSLHLCRFQNPWSSSTTMLFWGGVVSFLGTGLIIGFYTNHLSPQRNYVQTLAPTTEKLVACERTTDWNWFFKVTVVTFLLFSGTYTFNALKHGLIPLFSSNPNEDRLLFLSGNLFIAMAGASGTLVMMLCTELLLVRTTTKAQKVLALAMLLISFLLYFSFVTRMPLVRTFIYMVTISHYMRKQISLKTVIIFSIALVLFFLIGAFIRVDVSEFSELAMRLRMNLPLQYIPFINPYAYAVNNIWNMDFGFRQFVDGIGYYHTSHGFELFRGFFFFTRLEGLIQGTYGFDSLFNDSIVKIRGLNTVIYIWHFYKDFGIAGVFFVSSALSAMIHLLYYNTLVSPSHFRITMLGLIISMIFFSFMIPLWSFWNLYYEAAVLLLAHRVIRIV